MLNKIELLMYTGESIFFTGILLVAQQESPTLVLLAAASYCLILLGTAMRFASMRIGGRHGK